MLNKLKALIRFEWKKGLIGVAAAAMLLLLCFADAPVRTLLLAAACVAAGFLKLNIRTDRMKRILLAVFTVPCVVTTLYLPRIFLIELGFTKDIFAYYYAWTWETYVYNYVLVTIVCLLIFLICGRWRASTAAGTSALVLLSLINSFIYQFRGRELMYVDIFSIGTALNVASQYTPKVDSFSWFAIGFFIMTILLLFAVPEFDKAAGKRTRLAALAAEGALILVFVLGTADMVSKGWDKKGTTINNYYLNFYLGFRDSFVAKPENYSPETMAQIETAYQDAQQKDTGTLPNVIVIMNEAFSDFRNLDSGLRTNQPVMPFLDSVEENAVRGYAAVSVFGGNTANSEFEFLTGHSMAFLPEGTVPYQNYIDETVYSLPWLMASLGYDTYATHPYLSSGWARTKVYPMMGFDDYFFEEAYPRENIVRNYISDREMYEYVLQKLEAQTDAPLFLFGITMQNHGGYEYDGEDFVAEIQLEDYDGYPMAEQYLSLIHRSDEALDYLLTELEAYPEDTVVLLFGDHLPKVEEDFYAELQKEEADSLTANMQLYSTPFLIWANFDIPEQTVELTSLSYLSRYLLEAAGIELPPYYQFLKELEEQVPVVNALGYYSVSRQTYLPISEAEGEEARWLNRYAVAQYNNLFDGRNRSETFFGQYMN